MKVIVNYLDGSRNVYDNCDDIDVDRDYELVWGKAGTGRTL